MCKFGRKPVRLLITKKSAIRLSLPHIANVHPGGEQDRHEGRRTRFVDADETGFLFLPKVFAPEEGGLEGGAEVAEVEFIVQPGLTGFVSFRFVGSVVEVEEAGFSV